MRAENLIRVGVSRERRRFRNKMQGIEPDSEVLEVVEEDSDQSWR